MSRGRLGFRAAIVATLVVATGAAVSTAAPAGGDKPQIRLTRADQALAKRSVLHKSDLNPAFHGGPKKPDLSGGPTCPNYHPKQSDLIVTGAAASDYSFGPLEMDTEAVVLKTAGMVRQDWRRSILVPTLLPCLRSYLSSGLPSDTRVVSVTRRPVPHFAPYTAGFRTILLVTVKGKKPVRAIVDSFFLGRGRTEITFDLSAPDAAQAEVPLFERKVAQTILARTPD